MSLIIVANMIDISCFRTHTRDAFVSTHTEETPRKDSHWPYFEDAH